MTGGTPPVGSPLERGVPGGTAPGLHLPPAISNPYLLILTPTHPPPKASPYFNYGTSGSTSGKLSDAFIHHLLLFFAGRYF